MEMNSKGQAAVTDSMYFILIVTFLSVFLFGFANSYGNSVKEQISDEYNTTFATNALKVILYSSTPRSVSDASSNTEVDFLLALLKEDYSDDESIDSTEREVLGKTISSILRPIQDTKDYAFYITIPDQKKVVFVYMHLTNFNRKPYSASLEPLAIGEEGRFAVYSPKPDDPETTADESHVNYFCAIKADESESDTITSDSEYDSVMVKINRLLTNVGSTSQASSSIKLIKESSTKSFDKTGDFRAQADLVLWDAIWLDKTKERQLELFPYETADTTAWNCLQVVEKTQALE